MTLSITRRQMLGTTCGAAAAVACARARGAAAPAATIREIKTISRQPEFYLGWPTVVRRRCGELLVTYSGGREAHVCPFGRVEMIRSADDGATWSEPRVLIETPIDDRDSGVLETARGSILVTTFTSLAYEKSLSAAEKIPAGEKGAWDPQRLARWQAAHNRLSAEGRQAQLGVWMIRSTDGGQTFSPLYDCLVDSPHGPIQLADGRLLYAGKDLWRGGRVGVCQSADDGQTWSWLAELPVAPEHDPENYHELHAVEAPSGRIVLQIRNHNQPYSSETLQSESADGGKTWSVPHSIGVWGVPSHLVRLADGRLLMTYGHRRAPFGNQARVSEDEGRSWSEAMILSGEGINSDLGYPSTTQLADGSLLSVWYERLADSPHTVLRQAKWSL